MRLESCRTCGKPFKVYPSEEGRARFCSRACQAEARRGKPMPWKAGRRMGYRVPNTNSYRTEGDIAFVTMKHGIEALFDAADIEMVRRYTWTPSYSKDIDGWYAISFVRLPENRMRSIYMHRLIMGEPAGLTVDHINHKSLDNRRSNLRTCSNSENMYNRRDTDPRSRTGIQGVSVHTNKTGARYYLARVTVTRIFPLTDEGLRNASAFVSDLRTRVGVETFVQARHRASTNSHRTAS